MFTNPVNPTGVFYNKAEIEKLAAVIKKYNVFTISDEIFFEICFDSNIKPYSMAAVDGMFNRTLTLSGLGKAKGIRLSFACSPISYIDTLPVSGILKPIQAAAIEALNNNNENKNYLVVAINQYKSRIKYITDKIKCMNLALNNFYQTKNTTYVKPFIIPQATNVFLISFPGILGKKLKGNQINNSLELAKHIHKSVGIATVPGEGFYIDGTEMVLRIPISVKMSELKKGLEGILSSLKMVS